MGFFPFLPQSVPVAGGTFTGPVTIAGLLTTQAGQTNSGGVITSASAINTTGVQSITSNGNFDVNFISGGLRVAEGTNAKQGIATLAAGSVTVANTSVTASSRILVTCQILGTVTVASAFDTPRTAGTSFTIHASQATDTSTVAWEIFEPG